MKIITIPHPTLRAKATPVTKVDKKLKDFVRDLEKTLAEKRNPRGVGIAAPQVDVKLRAFTTQMPVTTADETEEFDPLHTYINPEIIDHSTTLSHSTRRGDTTLEGCLSIPQIWGPVPRWKKVTIRYDKIIGDELKEHIATFTDFQAAVIQHECDHLDGVLFIDYAAEYDLPLYQENTRTGKLIEISDEMVAALLHKSL
jgi:peptide deformylase